METAKIKKDGTPKKSGGDRPNSGRPKAPKKLITKEQAIHALEDLGYFFPNLWNVSDIINEASKIGKIFDSIEDAKKVVAMLIITHGGENFDGNYPLDNYKIYEEIECFFKDRNPYDNLVNF